MITINVKTKDVSGHWDQPMARNSFGDATPGYIRGHIKPNYPMPAIRHTTELIHRGFDGELQFFVMWRKGNVMYPVGDYPDYPLFI